MEDITFLVGQNLKKLREQRKLSLDKLAEITGVSKSMLGQIERAESSPTIAIVWKISNGLKIPFTALFGQPQTLTSLIQKGEIQPLLEDNGKWRLFPFFPIEENRRFEIYSVEIDPGGHLRAEPHPEGTQEFLTVYQGELTVQVDGLEYRLAAGDSIRFQADRIHSYQNSSQFTTMLNMVIHYAG